MLLSSCSPVPLGVFLSPNPEFESPTSSAVRVQQQPVVSQGVVVQGTTTFQQQPTVSQSIVVQGENTSFVLSDQQIMAQQQAIGSQVKSVLAEAQAHVHAGEARLAEQSLLEAVREFELARQLVAEQLDPSLQYIQQLPKVQGGMSVLSTSELQSVQIQRADILTRINQAYDFKTLYNKYQQADRVDSLRAQNKTVLQPVLVNTRPVFQQKTSPAVRPVTFPTSVSLDLPWDEAQSYIPRFQQRANEFRSYLLRADQYFPTVASLLSANGVPDDLAYFALLESGFQPDAAGPSDTAGLWQLSRSVAQRYGLEVSARRDERKEVEASTRAFARYMSDLYSRFGSWELAIIGYEIGEQRLQTMINQAGTYDAQSVRRYIGQSSQEGTVLAKLAAAILIAQNPATYGFDVQLPNISGPVATAQAARSSVSVMTEPPSAILYHQP